jgi:hypothetical protein
LSRASGLVVTLANISQEIDLDFISGVKISSDPALRNQIAQEIVDYMKVRVVSENLGIGRKPWKSVEYSELYSESQEFEAAGKFKADVNLTLSGDTMGSIDVTKQRKGVVTIAITDKSTLPRAYGHMTGFEGHPTIKNGAKYRREFFGVSDREVKENVLDLFKDEIFRLKQE